MTPNTPKIKWAAGTWFQFSTSHFNKSMTFLWERSKFHQLQMGTWDKVYYLLFRFTLDSKTREFQYKILNCEFTNEKHNRNGLTISLAVPYVRRQWNPSGIFFFQVKYRLNSGKMSYPD